VAFQSEAPGSHTREIVVAVLELEDPVTLSAKKVVVVMLTCQLVAIS
jgi:hypothetical protein